MKTKAAADRNLKRIALISTFGGLLFGYNTGTTNGALAFMEKPSQLNLNPTMEGMVTGSITLGAAIGALIGGRLSDKFGRKKIIWKISWIFLFGALASAFSPTAFFMVLARFMLGLAVGCASVTVPTFLAEISTMEKRGKIVTQNELMIVGGQFLAFMINAVLGTIFAHNEGVWRWMLLMSFLPALVLFFGMRTVPESPRWLYMNKNKETALASLEQIRTEEEAHGEINVIDISLKREKEADEKSLSLGEAMKTPWIRRLIFLGVALGVMQQLMGINVMMYYGTKVLTESGLGANTSLVVNTFNGLFSVVATVVGMNLMHKIDRRKMIITGITVSLISMTVITTTIFMIPNSRFMPIIVMLFIMLFISFFQGCVGPVTWLLLSEIFPQRVRGLGMGIGTFFLWITNFIVSLVFPILLANMGIGKTFMVFVVLNVISLLFAIKFVPETRGKSLEEIELDFKFGADFEG